MPNRRNKILKRLKNIDLEKIKNPTLLKQAFDRADSKTKGLISVLSILIIVSLFSTFLSSYYVLTKPVRVNNGVFHEAVISSNAQGFNPVVQTTAGANTLEQKVNRLLFLPLYNLDIEPEKSGEYNFVAKNLKLEPVLLSKNPQWLEKTGDQAFKKLQFNLKKDAKWSDGEHITCEDLDYTIQRLQEKRGNTGFKNPLANATLQTNSAKDCVLSFENPTPSALYQLAGFAPISKKYFENADIERIVASPKYKNPEVVSGFYKISPKVKDLQNNNKTVQNPVQKEDHLEKIILTKSGINNTGKNDVAFDQYIFKNYDSLIPDKLATNTNTVVASAEKNGVDMFTRSYEQNLVNTPTEVKNTLKMEQKSVLNNNYLQLFFNTQRGNEGYLINQSLRKYIACNLLNFQSSYASSFFSPVNQNKKLVPVELNSDQLDPACNPDLKSGLDKVYRFNTVENKERISIGASAPFTLTLIGYKQHIGILNELQTFLSNIGIDSKIISEENQVLDALNDKKYHIALLSNRIDSFDLLSEFSAKQQDLVSIPANDRIAQYNVNQNLENFSLSDGQNEQARANLVKFFSEQFVFMNLFQNKIEVNYNKQILGLEKKLGDFYTGTQANLYNDLPDLYVNTKRKFILSK